MDQDVDGLYSKDPTIEYEQFINREKDIELDNISNEFSVTKNDLKSIVDDYAFYQDDTELNREVTDLFKDKTLSFRDRIKVINQLPLHVKGFFDKFNDVTMY